MNSETRRFGDLQIGDHFNYQGQLYCKEGELSAVLLQWNDGEQVTEYVSHRFYPDIAVTLAKACRQVG